MSRAIEVAFLLDIDRIRGELADRRNRVALRRQAQADIPGVRKT